MEGRSSSVLCGLSSRKKVYKMTIGEQNVIDAIPKPMNAVYKSLSWSSENSNIATVNERGVVKAISNGETDVIFASKQNYSFCDWVPLYHERMYAILPKGYPLKNSDAFPLEDFSGQEFLMPYGRFDIDVKAAMEPVGVELNTKISRVDDETVIRMVGRGLGVSMMTELMIRGICIT